MKYLYILHIIIIMFNFFIILFVINISTLLILHNKSHNLLKFNKHYLISKDKETFKPRIRFMFMDCVERKKWSN